MRVIQGIVDCMSSIQSLNPEGGGTAVCMLARRTIVGMRWMLMVGAHVRSRAGEGHDQD